jgi:phage host-nuclease inhibitor protein Gam
MEDSMRHAIRNIALLSLAALAVSCTSKDKESAAEPQQSETAAAQLDKAKVESKEAARAMQDYSYAQRDEFVAQMRKELAEIEEELDRLSAKVDGASGVAKTDAEAKLEAVREKWVLAKTQLDRAENATESTWDDVKGTFKKSYGDLKDSVEDARQWLSDKIKP